MEEQIILIDQDDNQIGTGEKLKVHQEGKLHRCFTIFIFNSKNELLIQQREKHKYHCGGLWTNTCCGHPRPGETTASAAHRRLQEEMGFDCPLKEIFTFTYKAKFNNGITEHEFDHVFLGKFNGQPYPNSKEAGDFKWISVAELKKDIKQNPKKYTVWFKMSLDKVISFLWK